jgi:cyclohexanecarboxyl-CoA dehydrogenase
MLLVVSHLAMTARMEQRLRDTPGLQIGDGTAQIMKLIIARQRVGRALAP